MSAAGFAMALGLIAIGALLLTVLGVWWAQRPPPGDEPTEHGDFEP